MTRRLSLASHVKRAAEAARKAGLPLVGVKTPDGYELTFSVEAPQPIIQDDPILRSIQNARKGPRRGVAA